MPDSEIGQAEPIHGIMLALSIRRPYELILRGLKTIEYRSRPTVNDPSR